MKSFDLSRLNPTLVLPVAVAVLASLFLTLATRSIWIDEAMLLKDIIELRSPEEFFKPLPYYDQAEPVLASLFFKAIMLLFHYNIAPLRLSVLALSCVLIAPVFAVFRPYRWGALVFVLALIGHSFSMGLFLTELKHYFLEVSVSFLAITALWRSSEQDNLHWPIGMAAAISVLGFSTLIVSGALLMYAVVRHASQPRNEREASTVVAIAGAALVVVVAYAYMKYLTVFQLGNYDDYYKTTALGSLGVLKEAILGAYGKALLITSGVASVVLLFTHKSGFVCRLNLFFIGILLIVLVGRIAGFYPATYPRHVIWLAPFSMVIACLGVLEFTASPARPLKVLGWVLLSLMALQAGKACYNNLRGVNYEYVDNNALYEHIAQMPPTEFLVYPDAQPSLEYYSLLDQRLSKHQYVRVNDEATRMRDPKMGKVEYLDSLAELLRQRPSKDFSVLVSHVNLDKDISGRGKALEAEISRLNCTYTSYFYVYNAQLIRVHCPLDAQL
jgi:hypothetical protein